jgi:hypothetical protein
VVHHLIWFRPTASEAIIAVGCAHCPHVTRHIDMTETCTNDQIDIFVADSARQHQRLCEKQRARDHRQKSVKGPHERSASRK